MKKAIIIYGPPGSGKGTQAELLVKKLKIFHFDIGSHIEKVVHDPKNRNNELIQKQRRTFDTGGICDPAWVAKLAAGEIKAIAEKGLDLVLSGSLRTLFEAFGDHKTEGLLKTLEKAYGKKNILFFLLKVQPKVSIARNSKRMICTECGYAVLRAYLRQDPLACPVCGGKLRTRTLDKPDIIKTRLTAYQSQTAPVFKELKKRGYKLNIVNGEPAPYLVNKQMLKHIRDY